MVMQVHVSTDDIAPRDRVRFWCDYFGDKVHSITPSNIPDAGAFSAEASGSIAHAWATRTGIAGDAVARTKAPDELARNPDFFGHEMRREFAGAIARFRMIQHIKQHVDFPTVQVPVSRLA